MRNDADSTPNDSDGLQERFTSIVTALTEGELTFPFPFDLATSAALGSNLDSGWLATRLAEATAARDSGYEISIRELTPGDPAGPRREIIGTSVSSTRQLFALLETLMDELQARASTVRSFDEKETPHPWPSK